jgi:hypothetical protein
MVKSKIYLILPLLLAVLLLTLVPGCKEKETTPTATTPATGASEFTQEQMQQIFAETIAATKNTQTYKFDMDLTTAMEATGGPEAGKLNMSMNTTGAYDQANQKMHLNINMNMKVNVPEMDESEQNMAMDMYMVEDTMYVKTDMPFLGDQWIKMPVDKEKATGFDAHMVSEQLDMLESPVEIEFLRYEMVDGSDCYVFQVTPDMTKIMQWLAQQQMTGTEFDAEKIQNLADIFKEISYNVWITRDSKLMKKIDGSLLMDLIPEEFGAESGAFDNMNINLSTGMRLYDYNVPVTIELPEEAENAVEMPS